MASARRPPVVFFIAFLVIALREAGGETLYVAPDGNDAWSGRIAAPDPAKQDGPLASLAGARAAIRRLKAAGGLRGPLEVVLRSVRKP